MKIKYGIFMAVFMVTLQITAKEIRVASTDKLYRLLAAAPYSLILFYSRDKSIMNNKEARQDVVDTEVMLKSLSRSPFYDGTDLQIIVADVSKGGLSEALHTYQVTALPTFVTVVGKEMVGTPLSGFVDRAPLMAFIDINLKNQMNKYREQKAAQRKRDLEIARIDAYKRNYWLGSPYWDSYWYGGYYPYWYGPYFW